MKQKPLDLWIARDGVSGTAGDLTHVFLGQPRWEKSRDEWYAGNVPGATHVGAVDHRIDPQYIGDTFGLAPGSARILEKATAQKLGTS